MISTILFEQQRLAFYCRNALLFSLLLVFTWACKDECRVEPAICHIYEEGNCDLVLELNQELVVELSSNIHAISGAEPSLDIAELAPMNNELGDAYFVGLGEATHGSKEFFQMKDRIFRYLVEEHGFKVMGFEATWGGALHVNQYVLHGIGSAEASIRKMKFWTWQTQEVVELVEWMRTYNMDKVEEDKLHFYGFDMQSSDEEYYWINEYLGRINPTLQAQIAPSIKNYVDNANFSTYSNLTSEEQNAYRQDIVNAKILFEAQEQEFIQLSSFAEYSLMRQAFAILLQNEEVLRNTTGSRRDFYMAENSEWIRSYMGDDTKVALWAHNGHVTKESSWAQGYHLDSRHGDNYKVVGFSFAEGSFQAVREGGGLTTNNNVSNMGCRTTNAMLESVGVPNYYIIFNELEENSLSQEYFSSSKPFFQLGALYDSGNLGRFIRPSALANAYDILIHFNTSTAAKPY